MFKIKLKIAKQEDEQQNFIDEEIVSVIKGFFFATESLSAETEENKVLNCKTLTRKSYQILPALQGNIMLHYRLLCLRKNYFLMMVVCTRKSIINYSQIPAKNLKTLKNKKSHW